MPPAVIAAAVGAAGSIGGSLIGSAASSGEKDAAEKAREAALAAYTKIGIPSVADQSLHLEDYKSAGQLDPAKEAALSQGDSALAGISTDPRLKQAQMQALAQMQGLGQTGLTADDRFNLDQVRGQADADSSARDKAILANMAARGMGGGGAELAARLSSNQGDTNRAATQSESLVASANRRALDAIMQSGTLSSQLRDQDYGQQARAATAQDEINRFNTANRQSVQQRNVSSGNQAQAGNLQNQQTLMNQDTSLHNTQQQYNKSLAQQQFSNQMAQAQGVAGGENNLAAQHQTNAQATQQMWGQIGQGINTAATSVGDSSIKKDAADLAAKKKADAAATETVTP